MQKTALIVDDSKSARVVLKRMLEGCDLAVDTAESAEAALDYLETRRPDVIFMDHLMPGMDGFEAVSAIKKNPDTAMIPIMMYTSQEGEVYVGQARALGAVGVLPKTVEPVEVSKVLQSLHLVADAPDATPEAGREAPEDGKLRDLLEDLFDQQRVILQHDLRDTYSNLALKFADELKRAHAANSEAPDAVQPARHKAAGNWLTLPMAAAFVFVVIVFWQQQQLGRLEEQNASLAAAVRAGTPPETSARISQRLATWQDALQASRAELIDTLEWGINQSATYAWDEIPLGERRVQLLDELVARLMSAGFTGAVQLIVHAGNFCLVDGGDGAYVLPDPRVPASACDRVAHDVDGPGYRQSVSFANFMVMTEQRSGGAILFDVRSRGAADPLFPYPETVPAVTAGEWNAIAALNNRVTVLLQPE